MSQETNEQPRCVNLCSKSMVVYGENFAMDPDHEEDLTELWCNCTAREHGPDGEGVSLDVCCDPKRSCYEEY